MQNQYGEGVELSEDTRMCKLKPESLSRLNVIYERYKVTAFQKGISTSREIILRLMQRSKNEHWVQKLIVDRVSQKYGLNFTDEDVIFKAQNTDSTQELSFDYKAYAESLKRDHASLSLEKLAMSGGKYLSIQLMQIYVPQNVRPCQDYLPHVMEIPRGILIRPNSNDHNNTKDHLYSEIERQRKSYYNQNPISISELINTKRKIVILGDPGSGKSSYLRSIVVEWAERVVDDTTDTRPLTMPIFVELRLLAREWANGQRDILDFLADTQRRYPLPKQWLLNEMEEGRVLFCFDGLDEIFDKEVRREIAEKINYLAVDPNTQMNRYFVTSRVIGYEGEKWRTSEFEHFMLQDFEDEQIDSFVYQWHGLVYGESEEEERVEKQQRMQLALDESQAIRELAGNPLLLTLMVVLNRYHELPRERKELYNECSRLLLQDWKVDEALRANLDLKQDAGAIGLPEKTLILRRLARTMQAGEGQLGNTVNRETIETIIEEVLEGNRYLRGNPKAIARAVVDQFRERNFILCALGGDLFGFVHRTFLEYYIALDYRLRFEKERNLNEDQLFEALYAKHWKEESWHEVLRLLTAMLDESVSGNYLKRLRELDHSNETLQFLTAECWSEIRNTSGLEDLSEELKTDLSSWIKNSEVDEETRRRAIKTLARGWRASEVILILKDALKTSNEQAFATIFNALRITSRRDIQEVVEVLLQMLRSPEALVAEAAAWHLGIASRENPYILNMIEDMDDGIELKYATCCLARPMEFVKPKVTLYKGIEFITILAGGFWQGDVEHDSEMPPRWVQLKEYKMSKYPIKVAQFREFTRETRTNYDWDERITTWGWIDDHPMVNVSWEEARSFCKWVGGDLPTEAQWEKASRGTDGRNFPWGNNWEDGKHCANSVSHNIQSGTVAVGTYPSGVSPYGVHDMAGNVWEWCRDDYDVQYYKNASRYNPVNLKKADYLTVRGGSWLNSYDALRFRTAYRYFNDERSNSIGFRVVLNCD